MGDRTISCLIKKKTNLNLKLSVTLFVLSLVLVATAFVFIEQQNAQSKNDFTNNANTHLITITGKSSAGMDEAGFLRFSEEREIRGTLKGISGCHVCREYLIGFGIEGNDGKTYFIRGIDNRIAGRFNMGTIGSDTAVHAPGGAKRSVTLKLPCIDVGDEGFDSTATTDMEMLLLPASTELARFEELNTRPDTLLVSSSSIPKIVSTMFGTTWEEFTRTYDQGNLYGMNLIDSVRVYVDDLHDVNQAAGRLRAKGYDIRYILGAFEDLQGSLSKTAIIYGSLLSGILVITAVNVLISFRGYLLSMQKDMGILKHRGYASRRVYRIYRVLIIRPIMFIGTSVTAYALILSVILLPGAFLRTFAVAAMPIVIVVSVVSLLSLRTLSTLVKKSTLVLLNWSKETE